MVKTVAGRLAEAVRTEGVTCAFALMGEGNLEFLAAWASQAGAHIYNVRHEGNGVAMAAGFARATKQVGFCTVTSGPGLTQTATSLMVASRARIPVVVLAGDTPAVGPSLIEHQAMNQALFAQACGSAYVRVRAPETVANDVETAFHRAKSQRCPVILSAPLNVQESPSSEPWVYRGSARLQSALRWAPPTVDEIQMLVETLTQSRRPIVLAGVGAEGLASDLERMGDRIGALLTTTLAAKGFFDGSPFNIGVAGGFAFDRTLDLFAQADCVLAVGASLNRFTTMAGTLFPNAQTLAINTDRELLTTATCTIKQMIACDAKQAIGEALTELDGRNHHAVGFRTSAVAASLKEDPRQTDLRQVPPVEEGDGLDPRQLMTQLDTVLPRTCTVVAGAGHHWFSSSMYLSGFRTRNFIFTGDFGTIGQGLATGIGAAVGRPDQPVFVFEGDAAVLMSIQEWDTLRRHGPQVLLFVMNDRALGTELHRLEVKGLDAHLGIVETPDMAAVAGAMGVEAATIDHYDQVGEAVRRFMGGRGPLVADVRISRSVVSPLFRRAHSQSGGYGGR